MNSFIRFCIAIIAAIALPATASAVVLLPGDNVPLTGTTSAANPNLAGGVQNDNLIPWFINLLGVGGNLQNRVVESDNLGTLIFAPRIRDTFSTIVTEFNITGFSVTGYAGWDTDVDFRIDSLGDKGPTSVSRSADGDMLTFMFLDPLIIDAIDPPGRQQESLFTSILTNATDFALTGTLTIFGVDPNGSGELRMVTIDGIAAPVPVPAALWLLGSGLFGLFAFRRR